MESNKPQDNGIMLKKKINWGQKGTLNLLDSILQSMQEQARGASCTLATVCVLHRLKRSIFWSCYPCWEIARSNCELPIQQEWTLPHNVFGCSLASPPVPLQARWLLCLGFEWKKHSCVKTPNYMLQTTHKLPALSNVQQVVNISK